jgi:hypothetical protein
LSRVFAKINKKIIFLKVLTLGACGGIISMYQGRGTPRGQEKISKSFQKGIDKPNRVWYNKDTERERKPRAERKNFKKFQKTS